MHISFILFNWQFKVWGLYAYAVKVEIKIDDKTVIQKCKKLQHFQNLNYSTAAALKELENQTLS